MLRQLCWLRGTAYSRLRRYETAPWQGVMQNRNLNILYFTVSGRVSRNTFLVAFGIPYVCFVGLILVAIHAFNGNPPIWYLGILFGFGLVAQIPQIYLMVKRLHDIGYSWKYLLIGFVPVIGIVAILITMFSSGDAQENRYGQPYSGVGIA